MIKKTILKVGLTGGIGTGKTTVAHVFETFGVPVLNADLIAKQLMNDDAAIQEKLINIFGTDIYKNGKLLNKKLGAIVFNNPALLQQLNAIVHPATIQYANDWINSQSTPYAIKEAAIMIESQSYKELDVLIGVTADYETRIVRTMDRDQVTRAAVIARMEQQMDNDTKMSYCKYVINNNPNDSLIEQCLTIHQALLNHQ